MNKKVIILSAVGIIVIALIVVGALFVLKKPVKVATVTKTPAVVKTTVDTSKDYGACTLLSKSVIKSAIGSVATNLAGPDNIGRVFIGNGDQSQICVYGFVAGGTLDNSFNIANGFSDEVYIYKDQASADTGKKVTIAGSQSVTGLGDSAIYYSRADTTLKKISYTLMVYSKLKHYTYTISIPTTTKTLAMSDAEAQVALKVIAESVTY